MKDVLLCVHVVVKTLNVEIWLSLGETTNCTKVRAARAARLLFFIQPIISMPAAEV